MNLHLTLLLFGAIIAGNSAQNYTAAALRRNQYGQTSQTSNVEEIRIKKCIQCNSCSDSSKLPSKTECSLMLERYCMKTEVVNTRDGKVTSVSRQCIEWPPEDHVGPYCSYEADSMTCVYYCKKDGCNGSPKFNPPRPWSVIIVFVSILYNFAR